MKIGTCRDCREQTKLRAGDQYKCAKCQDESGLFDKIDGVVTDFYSQPPSERTHERLVQMLCIEFAKNAA